MSDSFILDDLILSIHSINLLLPATRIFYVRTPGTSLEGCYNLQGGIWGQQAFQTKQNTTLLRLSSCIRISSQTQPFLGWRTTKGLKNEVSVHSYPIRRDKFDHKANLFLSKLIGNFSMKRIFAMPQRICEFPEFKN